MFKCCIEYTNCWERIRVLASPLNVSTSSGVTLDGAIRSDHVAASCTVLRSATEKNDSGGYVDVPCPSEVKQRSSTMDWLKF